jgi:hypothetical protein
MKQLLNVDPVTGDKQYHHYDHQTEVTTIETVYNVQPVLEANKEKANDSSYSKAGIKRGWWHYGTIPNGVIALWLKEGIDFYNEDHWGAVLKKLRDPAYRYLKATSGKL